MDWVVTVLKIWIGCSLVVLTLFLIWRLPRLFGSKRKGTFRQNVVRLFGGAAFVFLLATCAWPVGLVMLVREVWNTISMRFAPKWALPVEGDITDKTWVTRDQREFFGGVGLEAAHIHATWPHDGNVSYRFRMLAPNQGPLSDWKAMDRISLEEWAEDIEEEHELNEPRPFEIWPKMERGRYSIDFRVETAPGQFEEFTGLTMIVT